MNDYKLGGIPLEKDVLVEIPTVSVHYSPEYYPQPTLFNPDRFMPANKANLVPYTFLPFGAGKFFHKIISSFSCYKLVLFFQVLETASSLMIVRVFHF